MIDTIHVPDQSVITVRLPAALHDKLSDIAKRNGTSLNKLCIAALAAFAKGCEAEVRLSTETMRIAGRV